MNETRLKIAKKDLKNIEEGKVIEAKDYIEDVQKSIKELEIKHQDNQFDINIIKKQKKNNQPFDKEELTRLENESRQINTDLNNKRILEKRERALDEIQLKLEDLGVKEVKKSVEIDKASVKHKDKNLNHINSKATPSKMKFIEKDFASYQATLMNHWIDRLNPLKKEMEMAKKAGVTSYLDVYKRMRLQQGMIGRGMHFIKAGSLDFTTLKKNGKGLVEIVKEVVKSDIEYAEFKGFAISKRALEKYKQGIDTPFTATKADRIAAKKVIETYEGKYGKTLNELFDYQHKLLIYLKDAGVISTELFTKVLDLNRDYVPFYRVVDVTLKENVKDTHTLSKVVKNPLKKMEGSVEKPVIDPLESIFLNTLHFVQIAERNHVFSKYIDMALELPNLFPHVKEVKNFRKHTLTKEEVNKITGEKVSDSMQETFTIFRRDGQVLTDSQIAVFVEGKNESL